MTTERGSGGRWPVADRSMLATVLGVRPVTAVGLAAAVTGLGVFIDLTRIGSLGLVFTVWYVVACVLAVAWVRRDGLFGPMVAPPLLLAAAVPTVMLLAGPPKPGAGIAERLLVIGAPLANGFPTMAWTTGLVVALGTARIMVQRPLHHTRRDERATSAHATSARDAETRGGGGGRVSGAGGQRVAAARGAGRTSGSPRRS